MLGIYLNLIIVSCAVSAAIFAFLFFFTRSGFIILRSYVLALGLITFFLDAGFALMGFSSDLKNAAIPHFIGMMSVNIFLLLEILFVLHELKAKTSVIIPLLSALVVYMMCDYLILTASKPFLYTRLNHYTSYIIQSKKHFAFHYSFIAVASITLFSIGCIWYTKQKTKHDKIFASRLIFANLLLILASVPEIITFHHSLPMPYISFALGFTVVFFLWYAAADNQSSYMPTIENTAKNVFSLIDTPILIFALDGSIKLFNPSAKRVLAIDGKETKPLRSILALSDVEFLNLIAKAKRGLNTTWKTRVIANNKPCFLKCFIKFDNAKDPYCIIGTIEME